MLANYVQVCTVCVGTFSLCRYVHSELYCPKFHQRYNVPAPDNTPPYFFLCLKWEGLISQIYALTKSSVVRLTKFTMSLL